ncbi:uncharacterized protein [Garra rufa]|uniref:uncharacterized protein n=1 Tax=Garra rufa TaxID=137080 RepID=UPI003CCE91DC
MLPLRYWMVVICAVFITTGVVSDEMKAVGDRVSFAPTNINPPVTTIIWKHRSSSGIVIKAIEWDDDGFAIPSQRFKGITTLDEKTGQITITNLTVEHSGLYTIDINSKEQEQRFKVTVMERVPRPVIETEKIEGEDEMKAVGETVSFGPTNINHPITSIIWKHRSTSGIVIKAIEWDDDGFAIPSQRFKGITTLDEKTGQITITNLTVEHSGVYTIDINSKEQEQRFKVTVMERVPRPVTETEKIEGEDEMKAVGDTVSFGPTNINRPITSIIWKHRSTSGIVIKAIEWDDDGFAIPSRRFKGITTLDEKTGQITITNLTVEHSGVYTIDINSKEQEQRFKVTVMERVPNL